MKKLPVLNVSAVGSSFKIVMKVVRVLHRTDHSIDNVLRARKELGGSILTLSPAIQTLN